MLLPLASCASSEQKALEKKANEFYDAFKENQSAGSAKKNIEYSETGSVAICYPVTKQQTLDADVEKYCTDLSAGFLQNAKTGEDTLIIGYESFSPVKDVYGVRIHVKATVGEQTTEQIKTFNFGIDESDGLKKLVSIEARDTDKSIKSKNLESWLITNGGIEATYKTDSGETLAKVPYAKLRPFLPESLKETLPEIKERVIDPSKKMVALTFDDGPHNTYTNKILDTLEKHDSVATFFEVGNLVSQGADTIMRAKNMGCEIASHTWSHGNLQTLSASGIKTQIDKADEAFEKVTGEKPKLLRPPYGAVGKTLRETSDKYLIGWSVDTNDWKYRDKNKVLSTVKNAGDLDGDVILMHSLYNSTAQAVEEMVPWLIENGYQLVTVSELIKYRYEDDLESGKYYAYNYFDYEPDNN